MLIKNILILDINNQDPEAIIQKIRKFDSYKKVKKDSGILANQFYFIGPRSYYSDSVLGVASKENDYNKGWAVYLDEDSNTEFIVKIFSKTKDNMKPVLVNEFKLLKNTLLYVSPDSNQFLMLDIFNSDIKKSIREIKVFSLHKKVNKGYFVKDDSLLKVKVGKSFALIGNAEQLLTYRRKHIQIIDIFPQDLFKDFKNAILSNEIDWYKIQGEVYCPDREDKTYIQSSFDIVSYSANLHKSHPIKRVVDYLMSKEFLKSMKIITSNNIKEISELRAFKIENGEEISIHCDNDFNDDVVSRLNILIVNTQPEKRKYDFIFEDNTTKTKYKSIENSAVYFYFGLDTPHYVPKTYEGGFRINLLISFNKNKKI